MGERTFYIAVDPSDDGRVYGSGATRDEARADAREHYDGSPCELDVHECTHALHVKAEGPVPYCEDDEGRLCTMREAAALC